MSHTVQSLSAIINELTQKKWREQHRPLLLSDLPPQLGIRIENLETELKNLLGEKRLKVFLSETSTSESYKIVQDPRHFARIGLIPSNQNYDFSQQPSSPAKQETVHERNSEKALLEFLRALKTLPLQSQKEVQIPVSVLLQLLK